MEAEKAAESDQQDQKEKAELIEEPAKDIVEEPVKEQVAEQKGEK